MTPAPLADTHCHLDYIARDADPAQVLARAQAEGLSFLVNPAVSRANYQAVIDLAERFDPVYAAIAVHPTDVSSVADDPDWLSTIEAHLAHPKALAIGETGLDYYWDETLKDLQQTCFAALLRLARDRDLPIIVHLRDKAGCCAAQDDAARLIRQTPACAALCTALRAIWRLRWR